MDFNRVPGSSGSPIFSSNGSIVGNIGMTTRVDKGKGDIAHVMTVSRNTKGQYQMLIEQAAKKMVQATAGVIHHLILPTGCANTQQFAVIRRVSSYKYNRLNF
jgi:hypothetical protein